MTIQEKKTMIKSMMETLPEDSLDRILKLLQEEKNNNIIKENPLDMLARMGIVELPIPRIKQKVRHTPIEVKGKPLSKIIIEDRR